MFFWFYVFLINIVALVAMYIDKQNAIYGRWRIAEKTLFLIAFIGGSIGSTAGMHLFHHKTKHWYFVYGLPTILAFQIVVLLLVNK